MHNTSGMSFLSDYAWNLSKSSVQRSTKVTDNIFQKCTFGTDAYRSTVHR